MCLYEDVGIREKTTLQPGSVNFVESCLIIKSFFFIFSKIQDRKTKRKNKI